jgi:ribosomal protein L37E
MSIARSSYYYRPKGRVRADEPQILARITALCERLPGYGYRRVTRQLQREGWTINHKRVARIMAEHDLQAETPRAVAVTSDGLAVAPFANLAADFTPSAVNQLWVADLTYIHVVQGFVYLAVILDAWSRKVVGYAISGNMEVRLTLAALKAAVATRRPLPGCIHHSDRGSQGEFQRLSQHLVNGGVVWVDHQGGLQNGPDGLRCGRQAGQVSISGKLSRHSGCALPQAVRARTRHWQATCRSRLVLAGSARQAGWRQSVWARVPADTCYSRNVKNSLY